MPSSVKTAPNPATYATAWRSASQREAVVAPSGRAATATAVSWPRYAGTSGRTHGDEEARRRPAKTRRGSSGCRRSRRRRPVEHVREEAPELGRARRQLQLATAQRDDRDREGVPALQVGVGLDVALDQARRRQPVRGAIGEEQLERRARLVAEVAAGARNTGRDRGGEGSRRAHCRREAEIDPEAPGTSDRAAVDEGHPDDTLTPVAVCRVRYSSRLCSYGGSGGSGCAVTRGSSGPRFWLPAARQHDDRPGLGHGPEIRPMLGKDARADAGRRMPARRPLRQPPSRRLHGPGRPSSGLVHPRSSSSRRTAGSSSPRSAASSRSSTASPTRRRPSSPTSAPRSTTTGTAACSAWRSPPNFPTNPYVYVLYTYDAPIGGTAPSWNDGCPTPPGPTTDGCVVSGRLSRLPGERRREHGARSRS